MRTAIGIDLGTTYSAIAIMQDGKPTILPNVEGRILRLLWCCFHQQMPERNRLLVKWQNIQLRQIHWMLCSL